MASQMASQALKQLEEQAVALETLRLEALSNRVSHDRAYAQFLDIKYMVHQSWQALDEGEWDQAKALIDPTHLAQLEQVYNPGTR